MANRTSRLTRSDRQLDSGPDSNRCAMTLERAGHGAPGLERRTGPRANRFQGINRLLEALLLPHLVAIVFSTIAIEFSAFERV